MPLAICHLQCQWNGSPRYAASRRVANGSESTTRMTIRANSAVSRSLRCRRRRAVFDVDRTAKVPDSDRYVHAIPSRQSGFVLAWRFGLFSMRELHSNSARSRYSLVDILWCQSDVKWWHLCNIICHFTTRPVISCDSIFYRRIFIIFICLICIYAAEKSIA